MLADDLIASSDLSFLGKGRDEFVRDLRKAHRFELDDAFTAAADGLGVSRPSAFEKAVPLCRPPYDFTWFETSQAARKRFVGAPLDGEKSIKRIGILMQAIEDDRNSSRWLSRWAGVLAWSFPDGTVSTCGIAMLFDTGQPPYFPGLSSSQQRDPEAVRAGVISAGQKWSDDATELPAVVRIAERTLPVPNLYFGPMLNKFEQDHGSARVEQYLRRQLGDWSAEQPFWLGVLALFHSRNAAAVVPGPDLTKLNKARRSRGQQDLLTYSTCRIAPKLKARIALEGGGEAVGTRAHFVRGHFKIRSSGVFWWSPFLRGDKGMGFAAKDYRVIGEGA